LGCCGLRRHRGKQRRGAVADLGDVAFLLARLVSGELEDALFVAGHRVGAVWGFAGWSDGPTAAALARWV
jgi:hypothetical protein